MAVKRVVLACVMASAFVVAAADGVSAQSAFAGTVKDTSGAVMPGVTVEAASPALIEKVRTAVTDENGAYRIIDLRPGRLHADVHAARASTPSSARPRAAVELHRHHQRRPQRRHAAGIGHGVGRFAGRRRAEQRQAAGAVARRARRRADRQDHSGPRTARRRRDAQLAGRRRLARDAADLLRRPRQRRRADGRDRRRPDDQRPDGRRRGAGVSQRGDDAGSRLPDGGRHRPKR